MSEHIATTSQPGRTSAPATPTLLPAEVDYVVRVFPVDNPLGLKALQHLLTCQVWKVLADHEGQVVQVLQLMSSTVLDQRFIVN
jgi:hypothetical protein